MLAVANDMLDRINNMNERRVEMVQDNIVDII